MMKRSREGGFSLVEVVMALAIASVAMVVLLGLLPGAADAVGDSHRAGRALTCLELVLGDIRATPPTPDGDGKIVSARFKIEFPPGGEEVERTVFFDADGMPSAEGGADFRVTLNLRRPGTNPSVMNMDLEARWPAAEGASRVKSVNVWGVREL